MPSEPTREEVIYQISKPCRVGACGERGVDAMVGDMYTKALCPHCGMHSGEPDRVSLDMVVWVCGQCGRTVDEEIIDEDDQRYETDGDWCDQCQLPIGHGDCNGCLSAASVMEMFDDEDDEDE